MLCRNAIPVAKTGSYDTGVQLPAGSPLPPLASALAGPTPVTNPPSAASLPQPAVNATAPATNALSPPAVDAAALTANANASQPAAAVNASQAAPPVAARPNPFLPVQPVPPNALNRPPGEIVDAPAPAPGRALFQSRLLAMSSMRQPAVC